MEVKTKVLLSAILSSALFSALVFTPRAEAKCSIRVADPLIVERYQECKSRTLLSYLYNDLITPFSFQCAKKLSATCQKENCANPESDEEALRCFTRYVEVLNECDRQVDDAARMAKCKDTKIWALSKIKARAPVGQPVVPRIEPGPPSLVPDLEPVTVEDLPAFEAINAVKKASRRSITRQ